MSDGQWNLRDVSTLCERIHQLLFEEKREISKIAEFEQLESALNFLPEYPDAIVWCEAMALCSQWKGNLKAALNFREMELTQILALYSEIEKNSYDEETVSALYHRRNPDDVEHRLLIIESLRSEIG